MTNKYFMVEGNTPIFTSDITAKEVNENSWTYEGGSPISGCVKWDESLQKVVRDLEQERGARLWGLKAKRERLIYIPLNNFDVDEKSLENIKEAITHFDRAYSNGKAKWIMADNSTKEVSKEELEGVLDSFLIRKLKIFNEYQEKKGLLEIAKTYDEMISITLKGE